MTTMQQPAQSAAPDAVQTEAHAAPRFALWQRLLLGVLALLLLIAATYAFAWFNANRLSQRFMADADANYEQGNYILALTGREAYDPDAQQYVRTGGYIDVERIWSHRRSWPTPAIVEDARVRAGEIIYLHLTLEEAEGYIQANIGRPAPYFGEVYLHLGELYLREGEEEEAREIYESVPQLFRGRTALIEEAERRLAEMDE